MVLYLGGPQRWHKPYRAKSIRVMTSPQEYRSRRARRGSRAGYDTKRIRDGQATTKPLCGTHTAARHTRSTGKCFPRCRRAAFASLTGSHPTDLAKYLVLGTWRYEQAGDSGERRLGGGGGAPETTYAEYHATATTLERSRHS